MIQILTYSGNNEEFTGNNVIINSIHDARSLDDFEINVIDLKDQQLWKSRSDTQVTINTIEDLKSLSLMIQHSDKSKIIILFPQNSIYQYDYWSETYREGKELKNMTSELMGIISTLVKWVKGDSVNIREHSFGCVRRKNGSSVLF